VVAALCRACVLRSIRQTGADHLHERRTAVEKESCCVNRASHMFLAIVVASPQLCLWLAIAVWRGWL
jgi:hypothetical protein